MGRHAHIANNYTLILCHEHKFNINQKPNTPTASQLISLPILQLPVNKCIVYPITYNYKSLEQSGTKPNQSAYDVWHCSLMAMIKKLIKENSRIFLIDESLYSAENSYEKLNLACIAFIRINTVLICLLL